VVLESKGEATRYTKEKRERETAPAGLERVRSKGAEIGK
jgi:hypothetical protein